MAGNEQFHILSDGERMEALSKAKEARQARAALKDEVRQGRVTVAEVLGMDTDTAQRMPVHQLLTCVPGIGQAKARSIMEKVGISKTRRVRGLGRRQREELLRLLAK